MHGSYLPSIEINKCHQRFSAMLTIDGNNVRLSYIQIYLVRNYSQHHEATK